MRFPLGKISITLSAASTLGLANVQVIDLLNRHVNGDSGDVPVTDTAAAILRGEEILSAYTLPRTGIVICIFTNKDRTSTDVCFFEEYGR